MSTALRYLLILSTTLTAHFAKAEVPLEATDFEKVILINSDNKTAPPVSYKIQEGSDYKLIYFWATWCPTCKEKMRHGFDEFKLKGQVDVVLIATEKNEELIQNFISREKITEQIYWDSAKTLTRKLDFDAIPAWYLVHREKNALVIKAKDVGFDPEDVLKKLHENIK